MLIFEQEEIQYTRMWLTDNTNKEHSGIFSVSHTFQQFQLIITPPNTVTPPTIQYTGVLNFVHT